MEAAREAASNAPTQLSDDNRRLTPLDDTQPRLLVEMAFNLSKEGTTITFDSFGNNGKAVRQRVRVSRRSNACGISLSLSSSIEPYR